MKKGTEELLNELKKTNVIGDFTNENAGEFETYVLPEILAQMLVKHNKTKIDVIKAARLDFTYGYQIFDGKKHPKREKLLQLAFGFPLNMEDTNRLLRAGGVNSLYVRCKRDVICMYCLDRGMSLEECNACLYQQGEETLIEGDKDKGEK